MPKSTTQKSGVSFVSRVNKTRTRKALAALVEQAKEGAFPASNPKTFRRRRRAIEAKLQKFAKAK